MKNTLLNSLLALCLIFSANSTAGNPQELPGQKQSGLARNGLSSIGLPGWPINTQVGPIQYILPATLGLALVGAIAFLAFPKTVTDGRISLEELLSTRRTLRRLTKLCIATLPIDLIGYNLQGKFQGLNNAFGGVIKSLQTSHESSIQNYNFFKKYYDLAKKTLSDEGIFNALEELLSSNWGKIVISSLMFVPCSILAYKLEDWLDGMIYQKLLSAISQEGTLLVPKDQSLIKFLRDLPTNVLMDIMVPKHVVVRKLRQMITKIKINNKKMGRPNTLVVFSIESFSERD